MRVGLESCDPVRTISATFLLATLAALDMDSIRLDDL